MAHAAAVNDPEGVIKVVLVDDHDHVLWGLTKLIDGEWPHMMVIGNARTVEQARAVMATRKPDVVVLDAYLGSENALEASPPLITVDGPRIVVLSGCLDDALRRRALAAGAKAVISKDAPAEALLVAIEQARRAGGGPGAG